MASEQTAPGLVSDQTAPCLVSEQTAPGLASDQTAPGMASDQTAPGMASDQTAPGLASDQTAPGPASDQTAPGPASDQTAPGPASDQTAPGPASDQTAPGTSSDGDSLPPAMDVDISTDNLEEVIDKTWKARTSWYFIGVRFHLDASELDVIDRDKKDIRDKFTEMIISWLRKKCGCTWRAVYDALKHQTVSQNAVAEELKEWLATQSDKVGKKRRATSPDAVCSKKEKVAEVSIERGPQCPSEISHSAVAHNDCAYFANYNKIHEFHVPSQNWTQSVECPQSMFGLAALENEIVLVGGIMVSGACRETKATDKIQSIAMSTFSEQKTWQEKYPSMGKARVYPQVVVSGKYLIVLGGWAYFKEPKPVTALNSVEVLDLEQKCWFSNEKISLPKDFTTAVWQSACICGENLFIAIKHDDPNYVWMDNGPMDEYPCYSLFRCCIKTLLDIAQEGATKVSYKKLWQELMHPHSSIYENESKEENEKFWDEFDQYDTYPDSDDDDGYPSANDKKFPVETDDFYYNCGFTLSCIDDGTLIAIGCKHIESTTFKSIRQSLKGAYSDYKELKSGLYEDDYLTHEGASPRYHGQWYIKDCEKRVPDEELHIYFYDMKKDSWHLRASTTDENGARNAPPSVAMVNDKIVVVRKSTTVHTISFT